MGQEFKAGDPAIPQRCGCKDHAKPGLSKQDWFAWLAMRLGDARDLEVAYEMGAMMVSESERRGLSCGQGRAPVFPPQGCTHSERGLSRPEWFAGLAMQCLNAREWENQSEVVHKAYDFGEAMAVEGAKGGEPAFPTQGCGCQPGMSKQDWFAGRAMQLLIIDAMEWEDPSEVAHKAYEMGARLVAEGESWGRPLTAMGVAHGGNGDIHGRGPENLPPRAE